MYHVNVIADYQRHQSHELRKQPPPTWFGMRLGDRGTHTSRTIMLKELTELLRAVPLRGASEDYRRAVIEDNLLGKKTIATRRLTVQRLSELYALDLEAPIFRVLRQLWCTDHSGRPLLALMVAYARDPLLRLTSQPILGAKHGSAVLTSTLDACIEDRIGTRFNPSTRNKVARNAASSWTQSGHLKGRAKKFRNKPVVTPACVAMAMLLGYTSGAHGRSLLNTEWIRLLDLSYSELMTQIEAAKRQGIIDFKQLGDVVEVGFPKLLLPHEEALCHVRT